MGYRAETTEMGAFKITRDDGGDIDTGEFVSYPTYAGLPQLEGE